MRPSSSLLQADAGALFRRHHHRAISYIVPKHVYAGGDIMTNRPTTRRSARAVEFKQWVRGSHLEFVRHDAYWQKELPYLDA